MSLAINSLILFFLLIVPGIIFRRFYYTNEFSKQFVLRDPFQSFVSNIIPGIIIQFLTVIAYHSWVDKIDIENLVSIFFHEDIDNHIKDLKGSNTLNIKDNLLSLITYDSLFKFFEYLFLLLFFSILSSHLLKFIVRKFKLDIKHKLLRFQNEWHYLFKGEIKDFKTFHGKIQKEAHITYIDVLTDHDDDKALFYTGLLTDYSLCNESRKLEHLYLTNVKRYDKTKPKEEKFQKIPGDVLVIPYSKVKNINLRYQEVVRNIDFKNINLILGSLFISLSMFTWTINSFLLKDFFNKFYLLFLEKTIAQFTLICVYTIFYTVHIHNKKPENSRVKRDIGSYKHLFFVLIIILMITLCIDAIIHAF